MTLSLRESPTGKKIPRNLLARLKVAKHRPGGVEHDQGEHGNWSQGQLDEAHDPITPLTSGPLLGSDNQMENFPDKLQEKIISQADTHLGTTDEITDRYNALVESAAVRPIERTAAWADWYSDRHVWGSELAQGSRFNTVQVLGATSALSPGMLWSANEDLAGMMVEVYDDETLRIMDLVPDVALLQGKLEASLMPTPTNTTSPRWT
jgi:hypothetical protein